MSTPSYSCSYPLCLLYSTCLGGCCDGIPVPLGLVGRLSLHGRLQMQSKKLVSKYSSK